MMSSFLDLPFLTVFGLVSELKTTKAKLEENAKNLGGIVALYQSVSQVATFTSSRC